jgi:AraC-like DNA-binding protein
VPKTCDNRPFDPAAGEPTVGNTEMLDLLDALAKVGVGVDAAARASGIDVAALRRGQPASGQSLVRLFDHAESVSGDSLIGLHAAEHAQPRGPLAHMLMSGSTLEDVLMRCRRFGPVLISTMRIDFRRRTDHFVFSYEFGSDELDDCGHLAPYILMNTARALRRAVGDDVQLLAVCLRHPDGGARAEIERAFGCPVRFLEDDDCLLIPHTMTDREPAMSNPLIAEQMERFAEALLPRTEPAPSFIEQVAQTTRALVSMGVRAERRQVGRRLGVSERTLHRRLAEEGSTFRHVRDAVLWELSEALMSDPELKLETVALSLGFGDAAAFSKAFKRRTGRSPMQYRRQLGSTTAARG